MNFVMAELVNFMPCLHKTGNARSFEYGTWYIDSMGWFESENLFLKMYNLQRDAIITSTTDFIHRESKKAIYSELKAGRLAPFSGMGFAIISDNVLNVCRWHDKFSRPVVVPQIYELELAANPRSLKVTGQKVEEVGAFCDIEERVYRRELSAWIKFLKSERMLTNKLEYLDNVFSEVYSS